MQNSGLGNTVNPLTSLADKEVYKVPMLLIIGWRGEPGVKDEPQHIKQGRITPELLDILEIPYKIIDKECNVDDVTNWAAKQVASTGAPVALLIKKSTFAPYKSIRENTFEATLNREQALDLILSLSADSPIVSTTGKTSREVFELRKKRGELQRDFLTVGGMGHTSSIALGAAIAKPNKDFICIDGDGSAIMHLGAIPIIASLAPKNLTHVFLNNSAHESVGGQPTVAGKIDLKSLVYSCGYKHYCVASSLEEIKSQWQIIQDLPGPKMIEIRITTGSRDDLGRPTSTPIENKEAFMDWISS